MHPALLALIEFVIILLVVVIIYNSYKGKNLQLAMHLNLVILLVAIIKFCFLLYISFIGAPLCSVAQSLYC